ncbi:Aldo-keto reductase [Mycena sanguinolenta]|uniref:Aldo-keto reductase n=1 Tax=Mycena sanguinolenta TaxID=230812 RepID=A0A8H7D6N4_9AGAR|nr:Aldo-keto reductase [Mycena sanguinolenta]
MSIPTRKIGQAKSGSKFSMQPTQKGVRTGILHTCTAILKNSSENGSNAPGKRNDIFLATKFGIGATGIRGDREFIREQVETSLSRLGVDCIDLYYQHRIDANTPIEVTVGAMAELVKEGKVKYLGLLCSTLRENWASRSSCTSPLGRGLLTGRYKSPDDFEKDDFRLTIPKYSAQNFPKILDVVERLKSIGEKHNATAGQVTLAWILAQGPEFVLIPGTKKVKYLEENVGASAIKLSAEEIAAVRQIAKATDTEIPAPELPK